MRKIEKQKVEFLRLKKGDICQLVKLVFRYLKEQEGQ